MSKNHLIALLIDSIHFSLAIYMMVRYFDDYTIDRTLSRPEEKYYKTMLATENSGIHVKVIFIYLLITLLYRMLYQMLFFETFGVLIQILVIMFYKASKFLVISLLFLFAFSLIGNTLFNDLTQFSTIFMSFNTMYESSLGGFDFSIYASGTTTHETYGRLFMGVYLF